MDRWRERTALVTGGASGIGRALCEEFLKAGINVVACDLNHQMQIIETLDHNLEHSGELMPVACDVTKEEEVLSMFDQVRKSRLRGIDICVNCAGIGDDKNLTEGEVSMWRKMLEVNILGLAICTREAIKSMKERKVQDGHIIHLCSAAGHQVMPLMPFYSATKFAVRALAEALRQELKAEKSGIRVTTLSPGAVCTAFADNFTSAFFLNFYDKNPHLTTTDVVASIVHALSAPRHVEVNDVIIRSIQKPTRNPQLEQ